MASPVPVLSWCRNNVIRTPPARLPRYSEVTLIWLGHIAPPESSETTLIYSPYEPEFLIDAKLATEAFVAEIAAKAKTPLLEPPPAVALMWKLQRERAKRDE